MGTYEIIYWIVNILGVYALNRLMRILLGKPRVSWKIECISYFIYYLISSVVYLWVGVPLVIIIMSIVSFFLLSFNHKTDIKRRLFTTVLIYIIMLLNETLVMVLIGYTQVPIDDKVNYSSSMGTILNNLLFLVVVLFFYNIRKMQSNMRIPTICWIYLIVIPIFSIYFIILLFQKGNISSLQILICTVALFLMNVSVSYLYDFVIKSMWDKAEKMILEQKNMNYKAQYDIMRNSVMTTKSLKHDLKNHFISLKHMLDKNEISLAGEYIESILNEKLGIGKYQTGNLVVDSIIGYKLQNAENKNIKITFNVHIPEQMPVLAEDMIVIIGNVLDNAIEAVCNVAEIKRWIRVEMRCDRNILLLQVSNPFIGELSNKNNRIITTKKDKVNHGIGLHNVSEAAKKYNGWVNIEEKEDNVFNISIGLYLN